MKKEKNKKAKQNKTNKHRISKPEEILFGFMLAISIVFAAFCLAISKQIPDVLPSSIYRNSETAADKNIENIVAGYPITKMTPFINRQNDKVAAYLIAIAKKESNWGVSSPKKDGRECYNYWGYRGSENPTSSGYSCFESPKQAVDVVSGRIRSLIAEKIDTPQEMVVWKCGPGCSRRESRAADKWVKDVAFYYGRIYE